MSKAIELDEASVATLAEKLGQIIQRVVRDELATMRASLTPQPPDLRRTGLDLLPEEQAKAVEAKAAITQRAVERPKFLDAKDVGAMLSVGRSTIWSLLSAGAFPEPIRLGRAVRWQEVELLAWIDSGCPAPERWKLVRKQTVAAYEAARRSK